MGVGLLVALENLFPPVPSEIVLPFAGFVSARGGAALWLMIVAATVGSVAGALLLYGIGRRLGEPRARRSLCRLPLVEADEVDRGIAWFRRHGQAAVLTGRFVPFVRSVVSLPAGASRMPLGRFVLLTALGSGIWNTLWIVGGYALGRQWRDVGRYSDLLNGGLAVVAVLLLLRFVWRRRDRIGA
ncbi:MAG: DedA family protein [Actinobacteria bacterium]|nr:DedA family protein [Actinomycetota bacterium]